MRRMRRDGFNESLVRASFSRVQPVERQQGARVITYSKIKTLKIFMFLFQTADNKEVKGGGGGGGGGGAVQHSKAAMLYLYITLVCVALAHVDDVSFCACMIQGIKVAVTGTGYFYNPGHTYINYAINVSALKSSFGSKKLFQNSDNRVHPMWRHGIISGGNATDLGNWSYEGVVGAYLALGILGPRKKIAFHMILIAFVRPPQGLHKGLLVGNNKILTPILLCYFDQSKL
ncbi:hypothetical protein ACJX0J_026502 [Zea mays]